MPSPRREVTEVRASFQPSEAEQAPWSGRLRQKVTTTMLDAGGELIEGTSKIEWDSPQPAIDYFGPAVDGELTIEGHKPCQAFWANSRFNHSGGWES